MTTKQKTSPAPPGFSTVDITLAEALRRKEVALAKRRELDYEVAAGKFVNAAEVEAAVRSDYAVTAQRLLQLPTKLAPRLAVLKTAVECEDLMHKESS